MKPGFSGFFYCFFERKILKIKKINDYTNRGLRLSRQIIIKRKGKKGSFV